MPPPFAFICSLFSILNPFSVQNWHFSRDEVPYSLVMDQNVQDDNLSKSWNNIGIPLENTNNEEEKAYKCNQCKFASSLKSSLRRHLKIHSGEKSNKCKQCEYSSFVAGDLRRHLKTHSGEKPNNCNQCYNANTHSQFEETFENAQWIKAKYAKKKCKVLYTCCCCGMSRP